MAKRVAGVTEKLMEAAKQEFLKNGYEPSGNRAEGQSETERADMMKSVYNECEKSKHCTRRGRAMRAPTGSQHNVQLLFSATL